MEEKVTTKTKEEILKANPKDLTREEQAIQSLLEAYPDWTLSQAIRNSDIVP